MVLKPGREARGRGDLPQWELDFAVIGEVTDTGHMVLEWNGEVVCDIPLGPLADDAPCYDRPYARCLQGLGRSPLDRHAGKHRHRRGPAEADGLARARQPPLGVGAIRPVGRRRHGAAPWRRRGGGSRPRHAQSAGDDHRLHPALLLRRPGTRAASRRSPRPIATCARSAPAAGDHQLPQLRQPAAARDHGPIRRLRRRHGRGLPRARLPGRERQRPPLQRDQGDDGTGTAILPTPAIGGVGLLDDWEKSATIGFKAEGEASRPDRHSDRAMSASRYGSTSATAAARARRRRSTSRPNGAPANGPRVDRRRARQRGPRLLGRRRPGRGRRDGAGRRHRPPHDCADRSRTPPRSCSARTRAATSWRRAIPTRCARSPMRRTTLRRADRRRPAATSVFDLMGRGGRHPSPSPISAPRTKAFSPT